MPVFPFANPINTTIVKIRPVIGLQVRVSTVEFFENSQSIFISGKYLVSTELVLMSSYS